MKNMKIKKPLRIQNSFSPFIVKIRTFLILRLNQPKAIFYSNLEFQIIRNGMILGNFKNNKHTQLF